MSDEMKLKIALLEADGYKVEVIVNHNTDNWGEEDTMNKLPSETFMFKHAMPDNSMLLTRIQKSLDIAGWFVELSDITPIMIVDGRCLAATVEYYIKLKRN